MRRGYLGLAILLFVGTAHAEEAEPIGVDYRASTGLAQENACPSKEGFVDSVLSRTARARVVPNAPRTFIVRVEAGKDESRGSLVVRDADGAETEREVAGDTCDEVVSALALIAALAIDPRASLTPVPTPPAAPNPIVPHETPIAPPPRRPQWHFGASAGGSIAGGVAPSAVLGVPIAIHVDAPQGRLAPSFHLAFERTSSGSVDVPGGAATFTWTTGIFEGCPHRWTWNGIGVEPCVRIEGGALRARGGQIVPAREDTRAWFALGAVGRAEWGFAGPLFLELEGGLRAPLARTTYYFEPNTTIYRAPAIAGIFGLGVGARFL